MGPLKAEDPRKRRLSATHGGPGQAVRALIGTPSAHEPHGVDAAAQSPDSSGPSAPRTADSSVVRSEMANLIRRWALARWRTPVRAGRGPGDVPSSVVGS